MLAEDVLPYSAMLTKNFFEAPNFSASKFYDPVICLMRDLKRYVVHRKSGVIKHLLRYIGGHRVDRETEGLLDRSCGCRGFAPSPEKTGDSRLLRNAQHAVSALDVKG